MKRRCFWTAALLLASGGMAVASDSMPDLVSAQTESEEVAPEGAVSPSDEPILQETIPVPVEMLPGAAPRGVPASGASWSTGGCATGCGLSLQCCERVPNPLDHVWDDYCVQKCHVHTASKLLGLLHIKQSSCAACPPPCHNDCHCEFGLPKLPKLPVAATCAPCAAEPCAPCESCRKPRRSLLGHFRKHGRRCDGGCGTGCSAMTFDGSSVPSDMPVGQDPAFSPPQPVAPPDLPLPGAPAVEPAPQPQGWLPLPRFKRLPL